MPFILELVSICQADLKKWQFSRIKSQFKIQILNSALLRLTQRTACRWPTQKLKRNLLLSCFVNSETKMQWPTTRARGGKLESPVAISSKNPITHYSAAIIFPLPDATPLQTAPQSSAAYRLSTAEFSQLWTSIGTSLWRVSILT